MRFVRSSHLAIVAALAATPALAQVSLGGIAPTPAPADAENLGPEEDAITVTGSRLQAPGLTAISPVALVVLSV